MYYNKSIRYFTPSLKRLGSGSNYLKSKSLTKISTVPFQRNYSQSTVLSKPKKPTLVILGCGWAGYYFLRAIDRKLYDCVCVSPTNHFLFTPLLPSTTVGTLEFRAIIEPVRALADIRYYQSTCEEIVPDQKIIKCRDVFQKQEFQIIYDYLIIGVGSRANTFGTKGAWENAYFLKSLQDARKIRQRVLDCVERASEIMTKSEEKDRLSTFVVIGGGPTSVEFAAELNDFMQQDVLKYFPGVKPKIILIEAGKELLGSFHSSLRDYVTTSYRKRPFMEVHTQTSVKEVGPDFVRLGDDSIISCGIVVWGGGVAPTEMVSKINIFPKQERTGRILVNEYLQVYKLPQNNNNNNINNTPATNPSPNTINESEFYNNIYAFGDCAVNLKIGQTLTAQAAMQAAKYLSKRFNEKDLSKLENNLTHSPFKFRSLGMLAYVGEYRGVADVPGPKWRGFLAFVLWRSAYLTRTMSIKNKILIPMFWFKSWAFGRDISQF